LGCQRKEGAGIFNLETSKPETGGGSPGKRRKDIDRDATFNGIASCLCERRKPKPRPASALTSRKASPGESFQAEQAKASRKKIVHEKGLNAGKSGGMFAAEKTRSASRRSRSSARVAVQQMQMKTVGIPKKLCQLQARSFLQGPPSL